MATDGEPRPSYPPTLEDACAEARTLLASAHRTVVLTGAGVSAESGVPTFRGDDGLWRSHDPAELATPQAFARDPRLVWEWYALRRAKVLACDPNRAHLALARWVLSAPGRRTLVTQNVDGLHQRAARAAAVEAGERPASEPLRLHGSLLRVRCTACTYRAEDASAPRTDTRESLPSCPACGSLLRPDVVWFGEALDAAVLARAVEAARAAQICLVVGTSALVHPAAALPTLTLEAGGVVLEVNPEVTPLSSLARVSLRASACTVLPALLA